MPAQMDCVDVPRIAFDASADGLCGCARIVAVMGI